MWCEEGYIDFYSYKVWYKRVGKCDEGKKPLLILHGGPGMGHFYLENLEKIGAYGRQVIFYDQLGCGNSPVPKGSVDWSCELWEEELKVIRKALNLDEVHILGQSWGGMLAMQYATHEPEGIGALIISSSPASMKTWEREAHRLVNLMPPERRDAIDRAERSGNYTDADYLDAQYEYYRRHLCRIVPNPAGLQKSQNQSGEVYMVMEGPSEFTVTGKLKDFDVTEDLYRIKNKTLILSGTDDEATPLVSKEIADRIPESRWILMDGTHCIHLEKEAEYISHVIDFLDEVEKS